MTHAIPAPLSINSNRKPTARRRGWGLTETLLTVGAMGALTALVIGIYSLVQSDTKVTEGFNLLNTIQSKTQSTLAAQADYSTSTLNQFLIDANAFPARSVRNNGGARTVVNPWNGAVTITGNTSTFYVDFATLPTSACTNLVSKTAGALSGQSALQSIAVNGTTMPTPVTPAAISSVCATNANTVRWEFN